MTIEQLRDLCLVAMADEPHAEQEITLGNLRYLTAKERKQAAACYQAIIGEKTLPAHLGVKHAQSVLDKPLQGTARMVRQGEARRILEEKQDERNAA